MVEFIDTPPGFEIDILGPRTEVVPELRRLGVFGDLYFLSGQVLAAMIDPSHILIDVKDVHIVGYDQEKKLFHYNTLGVRQYTQLWDMGGSYLRPEPVEQDNTF